MGRNAGKEVALSTVKENSGLEVFDVSEPTNTSFDRLDLAIHSFGNCVRDSVCEITDHVFEPLFECPRKCLHWLQVRVALSCIRPFPKLGFYQIHRNAGWTLIKRILGIDRRLYERLSSNHGRYRTELTSIQEKYNSRVRIEAVNSAMDTPSSARHWQAREQGVLDRKQSAKLL